MQAHICIGDSSIVAYVKKGHSHHMLYLKRTFSLDQCWFQSASFHTQLVSESETLLCGNGFPLVSVREHQWFDLYKSRILDFQSYVSHVSSFYHLITKKTVLGDHRGQKSDFLLLHESYKYVKSVKKKIREQIHCGEKKKVSLNLASCGLGK